MNFSSFIHNTQKLYKLETYSKFSLRRELVSDVDNMIENRETKLLSQFIEKGYVLNKAQALSIMGRGFFHEAPTAAMIAKIYRTQIKAEFDVNLQELGHTLRDIKKKSTQKKFNRLISLHKKTEGVFNYVNSRSFRNDYQRNSETLNLYETLTDINTLANGYYSTYSFDNSSDISRSLDNVKNNSEKMVRAIEVAVPDIKNLKAQQKLEKYSRVLKDFQDIKENITVDVLNTIKKFEEKDLPVKAQTFIREIRSIQKDIKLDQATMQQKLEVENLYHKRFPQVLEEYILISPRYRQRFKGHDVDPDNLLVEALGEIKTKLQETFEAIEEKSHNRLRVTHNYLKKV